MSKGTRDQSTGTIGAKAGGGQEREMVPVVEVLKAIHEEQVLRSGSAEDKMCLRKG